LPGIASAHVIAITADNLIVLSKRSASSAYSPGTWSASFEEQLTEADLIEAADCLIRAARRGAGEEFGERVAGAAEHCQVLGTFVEMPLVNASAVVFMRISMKSRQLAEAWETSGRGDHELTGIKFVPVFQGDSGTVEDVLSGLPLHPTTSLRIAMLHRHVRNF
jgi:hypothetical protein